MRWKRWYNGDRRTIKKFLLFPMSINHEVRWLEFAEIEQSYHDYYVKPWRNKRFIND